MIVEIAELRNKTIQKYSYKNKSEKYKKFNIST